MNQSYKNEMHKLYNMKQYHKLHKHLWIWLSNNPFKKKDDWFNKVFTNFRMLTIMQYHNSCFACLKYFEKEKRK